MEDKKLDDEIVNEDPNDKKKYKVFRYVELRGRGKYVARDGSALNPIRRVQPATIHLNSDGYPCFGGGVPVHLYVAHAWVPGYFEGAEVNHKDFDRTNYHADNLEWVTHADNIQYTLDYNYDVVCESSRGENNGRSNFTEDQIREIRRKYDDGMSIADILRLDHPDLVHTKDYKSLHSTYANICHRKTWKHVK